MKFDDLVYNILEQERKSGWGNAALAGAGLAGGAFLANKFPGQTAAAIKGAGDMYQQHVSPHVNKLMGGGKQAHAAQAPHPTEPQHREPGPSHAPKTHHPTEPQHREPGPSHAPPHDIELPDYVSGT